HPQATHKGRRTMNNFNWLQSLLRHIQVAQSRQRSATQTGSFQPCLESLEVRDLPSTTLTWSGQGATNLWSDSGNWTHTGGNDTIPGKGDTLIFPANAAQLQSQDDIDNLKLDSIQFFAPGYDVVGKLLTLKSGISVTLLHVSVGGTTASASLTLL